jgi:hypothetical protein
MTISTTASRISYTGNGSTVDFSFPYPLLVGDDLVIIETVVTTGVETVQVITTDYTVALSRWRHVGHGHSRYGSSFNGDVDDLPSPGTHTGD